jgi:NAD(P)-dependent dehydrogenase (short-subunit alcohol dehydrogenase family)
VNNAGVVGSPDPAWETPVATWRWVLDVNLSGVINGIRAFIPEMIERDQGHIVNKASVAGLVPWPFYGPYAASKHAIVGISVSLFHELAYLDSAVKLSVLCPGFIRTKLMDADRNWLQRHGPITKQDGQLQQMVDSMGAGPG